MQKIPALARNFSLNISQDALCSRSDSYIMIHVECAPCIGGTICAVPQAASLMHPDSSTHGRFRAYGRTIRTAKSGAAFSMQSAPDESPSAFSESAKRK